MTRHRTTMMRSQLSGKYADSIMNAEREFDDFTLRRGKKMYRPGMLPTDQFAGDKKSFEEYCKEQSGEVYVQNLHDITGG
ncbi:hypothetical protein QO179_25075 [Bacillus stercoris]|nr:hypothetical protein [Bacillus stercoris]